MNHFRTTRAALGLMLGISALGLSACDFDAGKEAVENFKILIGIEKQPTNVGVAFVDAATGNPIAGDFKVDLSGSNAIVDIFGDPITSANASQGQFSFAVSKTAMPTKTSPVTVRLSAVPAGYLPVAEDVVLRDTGTVTVAVRAMRPSAPSQGTQVAQTTNTSTTSGTSTPVTASTPTTPPPSGGQAPPQATLSAPAGAQIKTASGATLTGTVTTTVVAINPNQAASLQLLPTGLTRSGLGKNAAATNVVIGAMNLSFTVGSVQGASITNGTLTMDIPSTVTVNPATGQPWAAGQQIDLYKYTISALNIGDIGFWTTAGKITVQAKTGGGFRLTSTMTSLEAGWYAAVVTVPTTETVTININRNGQSDGIQVVITQPGYESGAYLPTESSVTFTDVPTAVAGTRFVSVYAGTYQYVTTGFNGSSANLTLPTPNPTVTVVVTPSCGLAVAQLPAIFVSVREKGTTGPDGLITLGNVSSQAQVTRTNNLITKLTFLSTQLQAGKTYTVYASSGSDSFETEQTVTGATSSFNYTVDPGLCG